MNFKQKRITALSEALGLDLRSMPPHKLGEFVSEYEKRAIKTFEQIGDLGNFGVRRGILSGHHIVNHQDFTKNFIEWLEVGNRMTKSVQDQINSSGRVFEQSGQSGEGKKNER